MATHSPVDVQEFLDQAPFPLAKQDLLREARAANVAPDALASLEELPEQTYMTPVDVSLAVADSHGEPATPSSRTKRPRIRAKSGAQGEDTPSDRIGGGTEPGSEGASSSGAGSKPLQPVMSEPRSDASIATGRVASRVTELAKDRVGARKDELAAGLMDASRTMRGSSTEMRAGSPILADAATVAADGLERASTFLEDRDVDRIVQDVQGTVRRQPILVLGGAFAVGLLAMRLLKAGIGGSRSDQPKNQNER